MMWEYANGRDDSPVESDYGNPKSISNSFVLPYNYSRLEDIYKEIRRLAEATGRKLRDKKLEIIYLGILREFVVPMS